MTISIIGTGNVATHLHKALSGKANVNLINSRTLDRLPEWSDCIIISVKDDAIREVAERLKGKTDCMAHTSGSVSMTALNGAATHTGVFYPLQTFTKGKELDYSEIPFFIEGSDPETERHLTSLARLISENVRTATSADRKQLHIAAVFACNFTNHLINVADGLMQENGMDYRLLLPLLKETINKLDTLSPKDAQTGPAARGDDKVINAHLEMLSGRPELQAIYDLLSRSIISSFNHNRR